MHVINAVLPRFSNPLPPPGGQQVATGLNEVEAALVAVHQRSAERLVALMFGLRALMASIAKGLWQRIAQWLNPRIDWQYEHYLQGAANCAELEQRMRSWDRRKHGWH